MPPAGSDPLAEQLAWEISRDQPGEGELALLIHGNEVLYSRGSREHPGAFRDPFARAAIRLIQSIHEHRPAQARAIVRARIHATDSAGPASRGMVKIAAKRLTGSLTARDHGLIHALKPVRLAEPSPGPFETTLSELPSDDADRCSLTLELARRVHREDALYRSDRPVAALLVSAEGRLLGWAPNANARDRTRHAELNLVRGYVARAGGPVPAGARLYASLKPCRMCAGAIWECAEDPLSLRVFYAHDDPGPGARLTVLDAGSPERRLVTHAPADAAREIQRGPLPLKSL